MSKHRSLISCEVNFDRCSSKMAPVVALFEKNHSSTVGPIDLPGIPTKVELVINLKTAKSSG